MIKKVITDVDSSELFSLDRIPGVVQRNFESKLS